jgi:hypothetical protein
MYHHQAVMGDAEKKRIKITNEKKVLLTTGLLRLGLIIRWR